MFPPGEAESLSAEHLGKVAFWFRLTFVFYRIEVFECRPRGRAEGGIRKAYAGLPLAFRSAFQSRAEEGHMGGFILAIDQGTTSTRSIVFDGNQTNRRRRQERVQAALSEIGWVEHDRRRSGRRSSSTVKEAIPEGRHHANDVAAIGITNHGRLWSSGTARRQPIHNAIGSAGSRTAVFCDKLKKKGLEKTFVKKTGLLLDPYFSGTSSTGCFPM